MIAAGGWNAQLHDEILVYNSGYWQKDHGLWSEVQKANWADVILKEEFKGALKKDVFGFFDSEKLYKSLAIPWKVSKEVIPSSVMLTSFILAWSHHVWPSRYV